MASYAPDQFPAFKHLPQFEELLALVDEFHMGLQIANGWDRSGRTVYQLVLNDSPTYYYPRTLARIEPKRNGEPEPTVRLEWLLQESDRAVPEEEKPQERPTSVTITVEDMRDPWLVREKLASIAPQDGHPFFGGAFGRPHFERPRDPYQRETDLAGLVERLSEIKRKASGWNMPAEAIMRAIANQRVEGDRNRYNATPEYELRDLATLLSLLPEDYELQSSFMGNEKIVSSEDIQALASGSVTWQALKVKYGFRTMQEQDEDDLEEMKVNGGVTVIEHKRVELIPGEYEDDQDLIETGDMVEIEKVKFSYEDGKFYADFDVHRGYYPNEGNSLLTAMNLSVFKHREDIPEHLRESDGGDEYVKRHIQTPGKRYYGIVEWFED